MVFTLKRLHLLVELSRRGTIAAVAEALSYSPSAVSQQLSALEKEAGATLLEPVGRRVRLTPEAEMLVTHAEAVLAELERAETGLEASRTTVGGRLRVAAFQTAVLSLVPAALTTLHREHPRLRVEVAQLEPEDSLPALVAGDFDLVLGEEYPGYPRPRPVQLDREDLLTDELRLVVPAGWPERDLAALAERPFIMEPEGTTSREWSTAVCRRHGFEPDTRYTSADLQVHLRMVESGLAVALLPGLAGADRHPGVVSCALEGTPVRQVFSATRSAARMRPSVRAVVQALLGASTGLSYQHYSWRS
jgi:DNA-binding transcriptional LysR family regulator